MQQILWIHIFAVLAAIAGLGNSIDLNKNQLNALHQQLLPVQFKGKNITLDEVSKVFSEKCKKASGVHNATLIKDIEKSLHTMTTCLTNLLNTSSIQQEIDQARPLGELDTVFHKYCSKAPEAENCLRTFNSKLQPCLTAKEQEQNTKLIGVSSVLIGYMCAKGGDQIALFVAEDGPECIEANKEAISNCANKSFSEYMTLNNQVPDLFNMPELVLEPKHCVDMERFESCVLHHLQQCREITPANVAESVFRLVKNETSCKSLMQAKANERSIFKTAKSGVSVLDISVLSIVLTMLLSSLYSLTRP